MDAIQRVEVLTLKGTAEADLPKYKRPHTGLSSRTRTIDCFMKRETLESIVITLNQPESRLKKFTSRPATAQSSRCYDTGTKRKVSRYLQERIKHNQKEKSQFKCIDLWGDAHYNNVLKQSNLSKTFLLDHHDQICEKTLRIAHQRTPNVVSMPDEEVLQLRRSNSRAVRGIKKKSRDDMQSMLLTISKRKEQAELNRKSQNLYRQLSDMLKKKMVDVKVKIQETSPQEFQNLRRCQNYCHMVDKNLLPQYRLDRREKRNENLATTRASTAATSRSYRKAPSSSRDIVSDRTIFQEGIEQLLQQTNDLRAQLLNSSFRDQFEAFTVYNEKLDCMMQSRAKSIARLR